MEVHPFDPIIDEASKILILGTFPSLDSMKYAFYYAHKRNQFWKILSDIFETPLTDEASKIALLLRRNLALWDIVYACDRKNSADTNLKNIIPQDIPALLNRYPNINQICFTGRKAQAIFLKHYGSLEIKTTLLPSPSPAYAAMPYTKKRELYQNILL